MIGMIDFSLYYGSVMMGYSSTQSLRFRYDGLFVDSITTVPL